MKRRSLFAFAFAPLAKKDAKPIYLASAVQDAWVGAGVPASWVTWCDREYRTAMNQWRNETVDIQVKNIEVFNKKISGN
jgi:hypothetical protein